MHMLFALSLAHVRSGNSIAAPCGMGATVAAKSHGQYHEGDGQNKSHAPDDQTAVSKDGFMVVATHKPGVYARK
jgi:hypothetical protein